MALLEFGIVIRTRAFRIVVLIEQGGYQEAEIEMMIYRNLKNMSLSWSFCGGVSKRRIKN